MTITNLSYTELLKDVLRMIRALDYPTLRNMWHFLKGMEDARKKQLQTSVS